MKNKKIFLGLGSIAAIAAPVAAVVACNSDDESGVSFKTLGVDQVVQVSGYSDAITKVGDSSIDLTGGFNDLRSMAKLEFAKNTAIIGVERNRILNDGLQVSNEMDQGDQNALQKLFRIMILDKDLTVTFKNADNKETTQQVFKMYSHSNYKEKVSSDKISFLKSGVIKEVDAFSDNGPISKPEGAIFAKGNQTVPKITENSEFTKEGIYSEFQGKDDKKIKIALIPSKNPTENGAVAEAINTYAEKNGLPIEMVASESYNAASDALGSTYQGVFLPVGTWGEIHSKSNFILGAVRDQAIATLEIDGNVLKDPGVKFTDEVKTSKRIEAFGTLYLKDIPTTIDGVTTNWVDNAKKDGADTWASVVRNNFKTAANAPDNPLHSFALKAIATRLANKDMTNGIYLADKYEAIIYGLKNGDKSKKIIEKRDVEGKDFTINLKDIDGFKYGRTSSTSSASSTYPELWLNKHITK